jgi:hypothetical protein
MLFLLLLVFQKNEGLDQLNYTVPKCVKQTKHFQPDWLELDHPDFPEGEGEGEESAGKSAREPLAKQLQQLVKSTAKRLTTALPRQSLGRLSQQWPSLSKEEPSTIDQTRVPEPDAASPLLEDLSKLRGKVLMKISDQINKKTPPPDANRSSPSDDRDSTKPSRETVPGRARPTPKTSSTRGQSENRSQAPKSIIQTISKENPYFWSGITQINYYEYPSTKLIETPQERRAVPAAPAASEPSLSKPQSQPASAPAEEPAPAEETAPPFPKPTVSEESTPKAPKSSTPKEPKSSTPKAPKSSTPNAPKSSMVSNMTLNIMRPIPIKGQTNLKVIDRNRFPIKGSLRIV